MNERDLFMAALQIEDRAERCAFLDEASGEAGLRQRVEDLLQAFEQAGNFLHQPADPGATSDVSPAPLPNNLTESAGTLLGPYKLLEQIGEGGFGIVWKAKQQEPIRRKVALKVVKPGMDSSQVIARFEVERQALALMDHPNIARVLDAGQTRSGRPYFVMDLVRGVRITEFCDQGRLTPRERLELFAQVCQAVQHAHQKGLIHRDIKPSNVLVTLQEGTPLVKVIDFGIAKALGQQLTDRTLFTGFAQMIGTPLYMSPEQAALSNVDVDTRSDVYSLGVLLYELLTGITPFTRERLRDVGYDEMRRIIREEEPPKPSTRISTLGQAATTVSAQRKSDPKRLSQLFRGELDWIVMKALEKDRNRRYETANGFARDVQRYLADEPVLACPPSAWYRFGKFARRNKRSLLAAGLVLVALVGGIVGTTWGMLRARAAQQAETQRAEGERQAKQQALEREAETQAVLDFVENKILAAARPRDQAGGQGYDVKLAEAVKAALPFVEKSFTDRPLIEAWLRMTMGTSFLYLGDANTASVQCETARRLYTDHRGPDHPDTLGCMNNLALSYHTAGRMQEALKLREETLQRRKAALGSDHPHTLTSMMTLAESYAPAGRTQEAIKLHEETLRLTKAKFGPDHPDTLGSMNNLANSYSAAGRMQEALKLHEETLPLCKAKLGPDHPVTLTSMMNLAASYHVAGRTQEALKLYEETLQRRKAKQGPDHPHTLMTMIDLATSYEAAGRTREALDLREETLPLCKAKLGPDHPVTLTSMMTLATSYHAAGRTQEALKLGEETLQRRKATLGPDHLDTLRSMNNLANSYSAAGRTQEALKLHEETLPLFKARLGPDHPVTLTSMTNLANSYEAAGRTQEALKLREETLQRRKATLGPDHLDTLASMIALATSYDAASRIQEAVKLREEMFQVIKARFGPDHPNTWLAMNNLALSCITAGQPAKGVPILKDALTLRERRGKEAPGNSQEQSYLAWTHGLIGEAEQAQLHYAAAVQAYARSVEMLEKLDQAGELKDAYLAARLKLYRQWLVLCRKAERAVKDLDFALQQPAVEVPVLLDMRLRYLLKEQKLSAAVESAARMKERAGDNAAHLYNAACAYALCAAAKQANSPGTGAPGSERLAQEAMALLKQAVARGYKDAAHMKQDNDLDALRQRPDFQKLLADLKEAKKD
jgi:serine/threonine protein kinase